MAEEQKRAATDPMAGVKEQTYDKYFTDSPDPWVAISKIKYGSDLSLANTVESQVMMADPKQRPGMEKKLLKALSKTEDSSAAIMMICKLLACVGSEASALPLAPLLKASNTSDAARVALEAIPGEEVNKVLREALTVLTENKLAGLIGTVVVRRDREAIPILQKLAEDGNQSKIVKQAVTRALEDLNS